MKRQGAPRQYFRVLGDDISRVETFQWLVAGDLKASTKALITAAQDQALNTNAHKKNILKMDVDPRCRLCRHHDENVAHIVSGCQILTNDAYNKRHNSAAQRVHWTLCKIHAIDVKPRWWEHKVEPVIETDNVKILWDFSIRTDRAIPAHKPDIVVVN